MAQLDQQLQEKDRTVNVHFRWMGSNALIASLKVDDQLIALLTIEDRVYRGRRAYDLYYLREWLAPQLGLSPANWFQVTLYCGKQRLTHDVLLGTHRYYLDGYSLMPHIDEASHSFVMQLATATTSDMVVHVTRCSDADCKAAQLLILGPLAYSNVFYTYCNNVAYMINVVWHFGDMFSHASLKMRQNEPVATAALASNSKNAEFVGSALWNKPSFVLKAAALLKYNDCVRHLGSDVRGDAATMLCLIKTNAEYFDAATLNTDFEFQCLAVSANPGVLCKLDTLTQTKVAERSCNLSAAAAADS